MKESWHWLGKYLVVIAVALVLGSVLAELGPFKSVKMGAARIGAGAFVRFIAHGSALALLWALGLRLASHLRRVGGSSRHLAGSVLALVTLIVVASAYGVLLGFITPMLAPDLKTAVDWIFIVGILAAALWLLWELFTNAEALIGAVGSAAAGRKKQALPLHDRVAP